MYVWQLYSYATHALYGIMHPQVARQQYVEPYVVPQCMSVEQYNAGCNFDL